MTRSFFDIQVFKEHPYAARHWSNTYRILAEDLTQATDAAALIWGHEVNIHRSYVTITYARISTEDPGDDVFATVAINLPGDVAGATQPIGLWNTVRVDATPVGGGKLSRWHYRLPLEESEINGLEVDTTRLGDVATSFNAMITSLADNNTPLVQPEGNEFTPVSCFHQYVQRKMHRKRRKTTAPTP